MEKDLTEDMPQITVKEYIKRAPDGSIVRQTVFKYDAEGREIERIGYSPDGELVYRNEITHRLTERGRELHRVTYDPAGNVMSSTGGIFDDQNRVVEARWWDNAGKLSDHQIWHYLDEQNATHYIRYWPSGAVREEWTRIETVWERSEKVDKE